MEAILIYIHTVADIPQKRSLEVALGWDPVLPYVIEVEQCFMIDLTRAMYWRDGSPDATILPITAVKGYLIVGWDYQDWRWQRIGPMKWQDNISQMEHGSGKMVQQCFCAINSEEGGWVTRLSANNLEYDRDLGVLVEYGSSEIDVQYWTYFHSLPVYSNPVQVKGRLGHLDLFASSFADRRTQ